MFRKVCSLVLGSGEILHGLSKAQGQWEINNARFIIRRRLLILLLLSLPLLLVFPIHAQAAAEYLPKDIPTLGGSKALMPALLEPRMFYGAILVGLIAGLITGVIGAGGGYILTPALMSFGVHGIMAVGTDQFHLFTKAIVGTTIHRKMGNVNFWLAGWFVVGSLAGATGGGMINRAVFKQSPALSDALISAVYVLVLGVLGLYAIVDFMRLRRATARGETASSTDATTRFAKWLQAIPLKPRIRFDHDIVKGGRSISVYPVIITGGLVGFVAAIMGVGGGFLTFPIFVYGLGVSTFTTVGTDILQIIFTTSYSAIFQYAIYGFVFYSLCVGMLLSLFAVQIGAMVTKVVTGSQIRAFYALTILAGFTNRVCALPRKLSELDYISLPRSITGPIELVGTVIFFGIVGFFALWILAVFARNFQSFRAPPVPEDQPLSPPAAGSDFAGNVALASIGAPVRAHFIVRPKLFAVGVAGLLAFFLAMIVPMSPFFASKVRLDKTDATFNQVAKFSVNTTRQAYEKSVAFDDCPVDFGISPRDVVNSDRVVELMTAHGIKSSRTTDGRIRIETKLGKLARLAIDDVKLALENNQTGDLEIARGVPNHEVVYYWWIIFQGLTGRFNHESQWAQANFCDYIVTQQLQPAYNFRGIEARPLKDNAGSLVYLLLAYIGATLWYGAALYCFSEGIGISLSKGHAKKEA